MLSQIDTHINLLLDTLDNNSDPIDSVYVYVKAEIDNLMVKYMSTGLICGFDLHCHIATTGDYIKIQVDVATTVPGIWDGELHYIVDCPNNNLTSTYNMDAFDRAMKGI